VFGVAQFTAANYISVPLTDIVAALASAAAVVLMLRVWSPAEEVTEITGSDAGAPGSAGTGPGAGQGGGRGPRVTAGGPANGGGRRTSVDRAAVADHDRPSEVARAYAPYLVIIALFSVANIPAVKEALAEPPWTVDFQWPGLDLRNTAGDPLASMTFNFNWLPAAGTLMLISGLITMAAIGVSPGRAVRVFGRTLDQLKWAIVTVASVLALAYVMNQSGQTITLGLWAAGAGAFFAFLSPMIGWLGVAVTGSDTSSNALFGALQVTAAKDAGVSQTLLAAANSSGGVLGKMISPQNLAIGAAAVGMAGQEGDLFRKVLGWSIVLMLAMCALVYLQSTAVLDWMVVK
jgi:lactate permease